MVSDVFCVVMAGGQGTRFWPESTQERPKQYLNLTGDSSLLQKTWQRIERSVPYANRFLATVEGQRSLAFQHSKSYLPSENIIFEPSTRNTAPCILLALARLALEEKKGLSDQIVVILASDHVILKEDNFHRDLQKAIDLARTEKQIVTIGIPPYFPHTGYGYIQCGSDGQVKKFVEKPDFLTAQRYLTSGEYFWNAGIFIARVQTLLEEFEKNSPALFQYYPLWRKAFEEGKTDVIHQSYAQAESISIDYAVMEKSQRILMVQASFDWNDLGSWDALESVCDKIQNNVMVSKNNRFLFMQSKGNIISTEQDKFVALINMEDHIIISNPKCLIVLPKKDAQKIKEVVEFLRHSPEAYSDLL